jgi:hypothetical protein
VAMDGEREEEREAMGSKEVQAEEEEDEVVNEISIFASGANGFEEDGGDREFLRRLLW